MNTDKEYADMQAYVTGQLPPRRRRGFEERMNSDPTFRKKVEEHQELIDGLRQLGSEYQIRKRMDEVMAEQEKGVSADQTDEQPRAEPPIKVIPLGSPGRWQWAMAASVAAIFFIGGYYFLNRSHFENQSVYGDWYRSEMPVKAATPTDCPANLDAITQLYYRKQYRETLSALQNADSSAPCVQYYEGITYLALDESNTAIPLLQKATRSPDDLLRARAEWYLALTYLRADWRSDAQALLTTIAGKPDHPFQDQSRQVLNRLR
ncbi:MAG: hypothetical protein H7Z72_21935 [Bacteroidetes bacterium]|nr:hypothetical protein [Fibrella sp.]